MMKHSVCIIDDAIPTIGFPDFIDGTKRLDQTTLKFLTSEESEWPESILKELIEEINETQKDWSLSAFTNPVFYLRHYDEELFSPDIIFFDWTFGGSTTSTENFLKQILEKTYAIVIIYTGDDEEDEVTNLIESEEFANYKERLKVIKKEGADSIRELFSETKNRLNDNFSFRYGQELKGNALSALDDILIEISKLSINDFVALFGSKKSNGNYYISTSELTSIISQKFMHELLDKQFSNVEEKTPADVNIEDDQTVRRLWSYRLYYSPNDNIVRKGDIIYKVNNNKNELFLVLSSDCHLNMFWKKNFGYIAMVPLYRLDKTNKEIKKKFDAVNAKTLKSFKITSLSNSNIEGITILPGIKDKDGKYHDYLLNAKEVFTIRRELPAINNIDSLKYNLDLSYKHFRGYSGKGRITVAEPFLSPLIQYIMDSVTGYGSPDFPPYLSTKIKEKFDESRK